MALSAKAEIRQQLNLKNLQRHDPLIDRIVTSTSHASLYDNKGNGWVKTGVEGPMFLFARSTAPHYGFFVLNRNGLEYVQEFLTPQCEVEVGGEFILYEQGADADCATGIWVSEEKERVLLSEQMRLLRAKAAASGPTSQVPPPPSAAAASPSPLPVGQSISLDMLFGAASPQRPAPASGPSPSIAAAQSPNPLDLLFANATISPSPARAALPTQPAAQPAQHKLPAQLEQLFAAASPTPAAAALPAPSAPAPTGMALLDSIFASARPGQGLSPQPAAATQPTLPHPLFSSGSIAHAHAPSLPTPASKPTDARALLAMLGHPMSPPTPSAPAAARALEPGPEPSPSVGPPSHPAAAPHTTVHPAPFALAVSPTLANPGHESASVDARAGQQYAQSMTGAREQDLTAGQVAQANGIAAGRTTSPRRDRSGSGTGTESGPIKTARPMFAPPVLSHDVFESLPLPVKQGAGGAQRAASGDIAAAAAKRQEEEETVRKEGPTADAEAEAEAEEHEEGSAGDGAAASEGREKEEGGRQAEPDASGLTEGSSTEQQQPSGPAPESFSPASTEEPDADAVADADAPVPVSASDEREAATSVPDAVAIDDGVAAESPVSSTSATPINSELPTVPTATLPAAQQQQAASLLLDKPSVLAFADSAASNAKVGLAAKPMSKDDFIRRVVELIQKPSLSMQLYGKYLERFEESME